jgi:hypothetical protein
VKIKALRPKITYANLISTLCLFLIVGGGTAFAASQLGKNSVGTKQLKNNSVTAAKIKNGAVTGDKVNVDGLATVPSAKAAGHAQTADSATSAVHAQTADLATSAVHAGKADSATVAGTITPPEALHVVGEPGEPAFGPTWSNFSPTERPSAAFYLDREGVVHLQGEVTANNTQPVIFTLPPAYRPKFQEAFPAVGNGGAFTQIFIEPTGDVRSNDKSLVHLNGITWRAGQ